MNHHTKKSITWLFVFLPLFLLFPLHKVTTSSKICCCIVVWWDWKNVSEIELDSSSRELRAATAWAEWSCRGLCKYTVIERSNQCNLNYFFFFLKRKRKVIQGILTVSRKKLKLYRIWGMSHLIQKRQLCAITQSCDQRKRFSFSQENDILTMQCRNNLHKKKKKNKTKTKLMLSIDHPTMHDSLQSLALKICLSFVD